jgi:hypothetical protein
MHILHRTGPGPVIDHKICGVAMCHCNENHDRRRCDQRTDQGLLEAIEDAHE